MLRPYKGALARLEALYGPAHLRTPLNDKPHVLANLKLNGPIGVAIHEKFNLIIARLPDFGSRSRLKDKIHADIAVILIGNKFFRVFNRPVVAIQACKNPRALWQRCVLKDHVDRVIIRKLRDDVGRTSLIINPLGHNHIAKCARLGLR